MKSRLFKFTATCCFVLSAPLLALAEVDRTQGVISSGPCPMNCDTKGITRNICKDWQENGVCFVQDLRPASLAEKRQSEQLAQEATLDRKVTSVERKLKVGDKVSVKTLNKPIKRVDVVVQTDRRSPNAELNLSFAGMGGSTQTVDATNSNTQVIQFEGNGKNLAGRNIDLMALNNGVTVESVHVLYQ